MRQRHRPLRECALPCEADPPTTQMPNSLDYPLMDRRFDSSGPIPMKMLAIGTVLTFLTLLPIGSQTFGHYRQQLRDTERCSAACASVAFACIILHLLLKRLVSQIAFERSMDLPIMAIMFVAGLSNLIMATCDVPVVIDPITGGQVHLLRWTEWTGNTSSPLLLPCDEIFCVCRGLSITKASQALTVVLLLALFD